MDVMVKQTPMEIGDYLAILRRRKVQLIVPLILISAVSLALAFGLPPVYRSEATILVERQEIPVDVVETTVTGYVEERIQGLTKRLLTRERLWNVAENLNLYPEERAAGDRGDVVKRMRDAIAVEMVDVKASDPAKARQGQITIAFTVSFEADTPEIAQKVAGELSTLYMKENQRQRSEQAAQVSVFLEQEAGKLRKEIGALEKKLAAFKQQNVEQLPGLSDLNRRLYEQTQDRRDRTEEQIRALDDRKMALEAQLSTTNPYKDVFTDAGKRVQTATERLSVLMAEYLSASAVYSPNHPDMVKLRSEIKSLEAQTGASNDASELVAQLTLYRERLSEARQKYSDEHPDVKQLRKSVSEIEKALRDHAYPKPSGSHAKRPAAPNNPTYITLTAQLDTVLANLKAEKEKHEKLGAKLAEYESRLFQTPAVERDYLELSRDYENAKNKYQEIKNKQSAAQLAEELEMGSKAERFTLVQPAYLPSSPDRPNRLGIALLGTVFAFGGGLGVVSVAEYSDRAVRGTRGIVAVFQAPPLAVIPYIGTPKEAVRRRKRMRRVLLVLIGVLVLAVTLTHVFLLPLNELWGGLLSPTP